LERPVNLGPVINTAGNESYPLLLLQEISSSRPMDVMALEEGHFLFPFFRLNMAYPVLLDPPINSKYDDFGIITDTLMNEGYSQLTGIKLLKSIILKQFSTDIL